MLTELNVNDIALIKKAAVKFEKGLNIMTGETGAGKSVIIDSALLALGGRLKGDVLREGAESAYIELVFLTEKNQRERLAELGTDVPDDGIVTISRKISRTRSVSRINGEAVSLNEVKNAASVLLDIYGQHEYHTLLDAENHLRILDGYIAGAAGELKREVKEAYRSFKKACDEYAGFDLDRTAAEREASLCEYEIAEIEAAAIKPGEEDELSSLCKKLGNSRSIAESLSAAYRALDSADIGGAASSIDHAARFDESLKGLRKELLDAESIISDAMNGINSYISSMELSEEALMKTEARLDLIRKMESKYGRTEEDVLDFLEKRKERLEELKSYERMKQAAFLKKEDAERLLKERAAELSRVRREGAGRLCRETEKGLLDLGFQKAEVMLEFGEKEPSADGADIVRFMASLNPGESIRPLSSSASGGELSRFMLSLKTVIADTDDISTLIFDEVDQGISGRTAQRVAEKLVSISNGRQVICITHLPQIASMADSHYLINKHEEDGRSVTSIEKLGCRESAAELARLLGGARITDAVYENAAEMKKLAESIKHEYRKDKEKNG